MTNKEKMPVNVRPSPGSGIVSQPAPLRSEQEGQTLRRHAEDLFQKKQGLSPEGLNVLSQEELQPLLHELQVHQIELEIQNEELRRTQEELESSRAEYVDLYDYAPAGYLTVNNAGFIVKANLTAAEMLGVSRGQLLNKTLTSFIVSEDQDVYYRFRKTLSQAGGHRKCELRIANTGTRQCWLRFDAIGGIECEIASSNCNITMHDITERKRSEEALQHSRNLVQNILETTPNLIYIYDIKTRRNVYSNSRILQILGYSPEEIKSRGDRLFVTLLHPEDFTKVAAHHDQLASALNEQVCELEYRMRHVDGNWVTMRSLDKPFTRDEAGKVEQIIGFAEDITERRRSDNILKSRDRLLLFAETHSLEELLAAALTEAEALTDSQIGFYHLVGPDQKTLLLQGWSTRTKEYFCKTDGKEFHNHIDKAGVWGDCVLQRKPVIHNEYASLPHKKGLPRGHAEIIRDLVVPVMRGGKLKAVLGIGNKSTNYTEVDVASVSFFADFAWEVSERKRAEEEHAKLQAQLIQVKKIESVGRLAGGVAHDFNNMLSVILGHAEMALEVIEPASPIFADLQEIQKAAERSADLTRQLLAFARKQAVAPKIINLNVTIEGMLQMLRRLIGENIHLVWVPEANLWPIKIDPSQVDQILANLCVNARDAVNGNGKVIIETRKVTFDRENCNELLGCIPGDFVLLTISDDGSGIDKETQSKIFEPFFTTKEMGKGTGLGLATVYGIVKQNDGYIYINSEPGEGTTFKIYLPRHLAGSEQAAKDSQKAASGLGHGTILLVEDELTILEMATRMLQHQGYTVLAANSPGMAFELAEKHTEKIDLLITDVIMPMMNGQELVQNLLPLCPNLKWLFMSGYTADVIARHGILEKDINFIQKPFSIKEITAKINEVLG